MRDDGMLENYYGPYSPYDNVVTYEPPMLWEHEKREPCIHLFTCQSCAFDIHVGFAQVIIG